MSVQMSGERHCVIHGVYWGMQCPMCAPPVQPAPWLDPTPALHRIALALERIAGTLEKEGPDA